MVNAACDPAIATCSIVTGTLPGLVRVTAWSDVPWLALTVPKLRFGGSTVRPVAPVVPGEPPVPAPGDPRLSVGDGLALPVVPPPAAEVVPSLPVVVVTPGEGLWETAFLSVCLLPTPSSRGISTPSPVTMAAMPEMIPGMVVQNDFLPSDMRHLLSDLDRGRAGLLGGEPQSRLRAVRASSVPQARARLQRGPSLPTRRPEVYALGSLSELTAHPPARSPRRWRSRGGWPPLRPGAPAGSPRRRSPRSPRRQAHARGTPPGTRRPGRAGSRAGSRRWGR